MELEDLRRFAVVARRGGFAAAAEELGLDPSTLSRRIAGLERAAGARLLHRTTRSMALTAEGARLLAAAEAALDGLDAARAEIVGQGGAPRGPVRITASAAFGERALVPLLPGLRRAYPELSLELRLSDAALDLAAEGIDLALRLGPEPDGPARLLRPVRYHVCAAPGTAAPDAPEALSDMDCLLYALPGLRDRWSFRRPGGLIRRVAVRGPLAISSALALRRAALAGLGPALLADWLAAEDLAAGRLVDLFPQEEAAPGRFDAGLWVLRPPGGGPPPLRVKAAMDWLAERLAAPAPPWRRPAGASGEE